MFKPKSPERSTIVDSARFNNLDAVRVFAAFLVIYGHSAILAGGVPPALWHTSVSTTGVEMFLSVSGYLITQSWQRDPHLLRFLAKRALRIFPALVVCVFLTACILGPLVSERSIGGYYSDPVFIEYFKNIILKIRYFLPDVFASNIYKYAVNGSLWTLPVEFFCYLVLAFISIRQRAPNVIILAILTIFACLSDVYFTRFYTGQPIIIYDSSVKDVAAITPFFFIGSILCLLKSWVPVRLDVSIVLIWGLLALDGVGWTDAVLVGAVFVVPYCTLAFGLASTPLLRRCGRFGDLSYGMYLYAFPIQQTLVFVSKNTITFPLLLAATTVLSGILAFISWHIVEHPALTLKPGRSAQPRDGTAEKAGSAGGRAASVANVLERVGHI